MSAPETVVWVDAPIWERIPALQDRFPHDDTKCSVCDERIGAMLIPLWYNHDVDSEEFVGFYVLADQAVCEDCCEAGC